MKHFTSIITTTLPLFFACATISVAQDNMPSPIVVSSQKQLFIDKLFFASTDNVRLKVNTAFKTGEKNLESDKPWENATLNWFSLMEDRENVKETGAAYRMWYECYDLEGWPTEDDTSFCYAESKDGIHWYKPALGLFEYHCNHENNILFRMIGPDGAHSRVHGACVFKDASASADSRYKAVSQGIFKSLGNQPYRIAGMHSPDGFHWTRYPAPICDIFADSQYSAFWDTALSSYVLYGRVEGRGRAIGRSTSTRFDTFIPLELVLSADDNDPPDSDLYNPAALKYPYAANAHFMFPSLFRHNDQTLDIRLAVSRDGIRWSWPDQSAAFIPLGDQGAFDSGSLYMGQGLLRVGDELWQFYSGAPLRHDEESSEKPGARCFSRVVTRLDGYVSVEAGPEGGSFTTPPLVFEGNCLKLNVNVRNGGSLRVGLLDEQGRPISGWATEECIAITGDHIDVPVSWQNGHDVSGRISIPTQLQFQLKDASLYAFQFTTQ